MNLTDKDKTEIKDAGAPLAADADTEKKQKKPFIIQTSVIISACLVLVSIAAYFVYNYYFLRIPESVPWLENVIWETEYEGVTFYYEFGEEELNGKTVNVVRAHYGTYEESCTYEKSMAANQLSMDYNIGILAMNTDVSDDPNEKTYNIEYSITGSRILGNQVMTIRYPNHPEYGPFVLKQVKERKATPLVPEDYTVDSELLGEWVSIYSSDSEREAVEFHDDGSMQFKRKEIYTDNKYHELCIDLTYSLSDSTVNLTYVYAEDDPTVFSSDYVIIENKVLYFLENYFTRDGSIPVLSGMNATPDEAEG